MSVDAPIEVPCLACGNATSSRCATCRQHFCNGCTNERGDCEACEHDEEDYDEPEPDDEDNDPEWDECPKRDGESHCDHWWDGEACCACGAPAMSEEDRRAQGMLDDEDERQARLERAINDERGTGGDE